MRSDASVAPTVASMLSGLRRETGPPDAELAVVREASAPTRWNVRMDGQLMMACEQLSEALHGLMVFVNQRVIAARHDLLSLHAAAAAFHGRGVLVPGSSGSGKTTLCARLLQRGARYLTDDSVAVSRDGQLHGYARPLGCKGPARQLFDDVDFAGLDLDPGLQSVWQVPPGRFGAAAAEAVAPALVVVPRFEAGACLAVEPVHPHVAARELISQVQNLASFGVTAALEVVGDLVAGCPSHVFTYGDAREAAVAIEGLLGTSPIRVPAPFRVLPASGTGDGTRAGRHPSPPGDLTALCFEEGALLMRETTGEVVTVDGIGSTAWPLLDGSRTIAAVAEELSEAFDAPPDRVTADLGLWVEELVGHGFLVRSS